LKVIDYVSDVINATWIQPHLISKLRHAGIQSVLDLFHKSSREDSGKHVIHNTFSIRAIQWS